MFSVLVLQKPSLIFLLPGTLGVDKREILGNAGNIFPNLGTYSDVHVCPTNSNEKKKELSGILTYASIFCFMETL